MVKAGPFLGEFGWELMKWQGYLRSFMSAEKGTVYCKFGHSFLYKDFAWTIEVTENLPAGVGMPNKWMPTINMPGPIQPCKRICEDKHLKQKFIKYGKSDGIWCDVLVHARNCRRAGDNLTGNRRFNPGKWNDLIASLGRANVGCVGTKEDSDIVPYARDYRGIPLEQLADLMASSKLIIGPSSGVMHFAALCGLPHLVWTDKRRWNVGGIKTTNWNRYMKHWNPLGTKAVVIDTEGWHPSVATILRQIEKHQLI